MVKQEKRQHSRAEIKWPVTMLNAQTKLKGEIENVSPYGAFVCCKEVPPLDGNFFMVIEAPDQKTMSIAARVTWSTVLETDAGDSCFGVGVRFTNVSASDRQYLYSVIAKHYRLKNNQRAEKKP
ncbi:MAG: PilZ domain-containing protein [Deltaproteobacteria bacterium]|nr:MAG: PilZ domain-containing protein [Deltaproteobacteria bacterium]